MADQFLRLSVEAAKRARWIAAEFDLTADQEGWLLVSFARSKTNAQHYRFVRRMFAHNISQSSD